MGDRISSAVLIVARVAAVTVGTVLLGVAAAYAYFTATGQGTGAAAVGPSVHWSVTGADGSGAPGTTALMEPGGAPADFTYRVTNAGGGHQGLQSANVVLATATDAHGNTVVVDSATGSGVAGCLASWFSVGASSFVSALPADLAGGDFVVGHAPVSMATLDGPQDACAGATLRLTVTAG